jgi:pimeloyl-ACP methyl ester carboxylesterase
MANQKDLVVLLPGITGSVLSRRKKNGKVEDLWGVSGSALWAALRSLGKSIKELELSSDEDDDGVFASRLVADATIIPKLWKIDGYTVPANYIVNLGFRRGENFFEFPYDWRRDNRIAARQLQDMAMSRLAAWRTASGAADARLILVGHSMGGLVSRYFLECLGGWEHTRALFTFGTPHRGSLNALDFLVNGMKKGAGPVALDVSDLLRSLTSVYQLLPHYPCIESDSGMQRVAAAAESGLLSQHVNHERAAASAAFYEEIIACQASNAQDQRYRDEGYSVHPIVGIEQPTNQSARINGTGIDLLHTYEGRDHGGDGTVPRVSAVPFEMSDAGDEIFAADRHASLQNEPGVLANVKGVLSRTAVDLRRFRAEVPITLSLDLEDLYLATEPVVIRAQPSEKQPRLVAHVTNLESGAVETIEFARADGRWQQAEAELPPGSYRVTVDAEGVQPVTDLFTVDEGV